jgi:MoaD family protein
VKVKVEYLGRIKNTIDVGSEIEIEVGENASIVDLLTILSGKYGEAFRRAVYETTSTGLEPKCVITINGYLLRDLNGMKTNLRDRDRVVLVPIVSGG